MARMATQVCTCRISAQHSRAQQLHHAFIRESVLVRDPSECRENVNIQSLLFKLKGERSGFIECRRSHYRRRPAHKSRAYVTVDLRSFLRELCERV